LPAACLPLLEHVAAAGACCRLLAAAYSLLASGCQGLSMLRMRAPNQ